MSLVFRNALMPSDDQQALRLRQTYLMASNKKGDFFLAIICFIGGWIGLAGGGVGNLTALLFGLGFVVYGLTKLWSII